MIDITINCHFCGKKFKGIEGKEDTCPACLNKLINACPKCGVIHDVNLAGGHDLIEANAVLICECKDHPEDEFCKEVLKNN